MVQRITIDAAQYRKPDEVSGTSGSGIVLSAEQVHYLHRVLRLQAGDRFIAQTGKGQQWLAALTEDVTLAAVIEPIVPVVGTSAAPLRLVAALPKGNSFDQVVRQATELGVSHIYPVISERTLLRPSQNKQLRWQKIAQEASEQSERITVPEIADSVAFSTLLKQQNWAGGRYICATRQSAPHLLKKIQSDLLSADTLDITLMVGPEGGWTSTEITDAIAADYEVVALGSAILRSVTAAITALSLASAARELLI